MPRVFISELKVGEFPRCWCREDQIPASSQIPSDLPRRPDFPIAGSPWQVSFADYETLRAHSEYAAWMAAWGFRANHFTVLVNALKSFSSLGELNEFLKKNGFKLNASSSEIKGSPQVYLEQSSTLADEAEVRFLDGSYRVPACYYEFAPVPDGRRWALQRLRRKIRRQNLREHQSEKVMDRQLSGHLPSSMRSCRLRRSMEEGE